MFAFKKNVIFILYERVLYDVLALSRNSFLSHLNERSLVVFVDVFVMT